MKTLSSGPRTREDIKAHLNKVSEVHLHRYAHGIQAMWGLVLSKKTNLCGTQRCYHMKLIRRDGVVVREANHER